MTFEQYLQEKRYSRSTIHHYRLYADLFTQWLTQEQLAGEQATYNDVIAFMRYLNEQGKSKKPVHSQMNVIRHYFPYLISEGKRADNPAAGIYVQGIVRKLHSTLRAMDGD